MRRTPFALRAVCAALRFQAATAEVLAPQCECRPCNSQCFPVWCEIDTLAGQLGRFAPPLTDAHVSAALSKIENPGYGDETSCATPHVHTVSERTFPMNTGTLKFYNDQKGFGFIQPDTGEKDVFVHATALERAGINALREGQKVNFDTQNDPRSGKTAVGRIEIA